MLKRARIRGYKCLKDVTVDLEPFTVLIGRNDSGKSSFLQAIAEPTHLVFGRELRNRAGWSVRLENDQHAVEFLGDGRRGSAPRTQSDIALAVQAGPPLPRGDFDGFVTSDPIALDPVSIAEQAHSSSAPIQVFIASRGGGTAAHLAALALGDRERFDSIERALRDVTKGRVKNIIVHDVGNSTYALSFRLHDATVIPAAELSQGLLLLVAFLSLTHREPMPRTILVEEPESGLHPLRLFEIVGLLRTLTERGTQVVLTTHSPDLLSACKPNEVRIFQRPKADSPTEVHVIPADFERRAMRETLGEVWASRGEEGLLDVVAQPIVPPIQADPK